MVGGAARTWKGTKPPHLASPRRSLSIYSHLLVQMPTGRRPRAWQACIPFGATSNPVWVPTVSISCINRLGCRGLMLGMLSAEH